MRAKLMYALLIATIFLMASVAGAQNTQFDVTGFIQSATLDPTCASSLTCGGTITVNNQVITIPKNTLLQMPATALTWQQVFTMAPAGFGVNSVTGVPQTGMAKSDNPKLHGDYEAHVVGNRNNGVWIAGLVFLAQHSLQSGQGFINFIDYTTGEFYVGGPMNTVAGMKVKINDPIGRFGRVWTPDARFTIDEDNPTVRSETGYPMCIPRVAPPAPPAPGVAIVETDALCPSVNRPLDATQPSGFAMVLNMVDPALVDANPTSNIPDARLMAPFEVGDYVTYSGVLSLDAANNPYVAAYQVIGNVGLFTARGIDPAYVAIDVGLLGVGGNTVAGLTEATVRTRFEGFVTDASRNVVIEGVDVDACTGLESPRNWGVMGIDPGPPNGAVLGRWRFRPPCKATSLAGVDSKTCLGPAAGLFLPATREVRASIETVTGSGIAKAAFATKNGLGANVYQAPIFEFLFPENAAVGSPVPPNNFEDMPFLANGSGLLDSTLPYNPVSNPVIGQLDPFPQGFVTIAKPSACPSTGVATAPVANAGPNQLVSIGATVTLTGAASVDTNTPLQTLTYLWSQTGGANVVTLSDPTAVSPTFTAPATADTLTFSLKVTNFSGLSSTASVTVQVSGLPIANAGVNQSVLQGALVSLNGTASTDAGFPPLNFAWTSVNPIIKLSGANTATPSFTAPTVSVPTTYSFTLRVTNKAGAVSAPATVSVTVNPPPAAPVANAGAPQTVLSGTKPVTLNGTASTGAVSYQWTQISGPAVGLSNANTAIATFTAPTVNLLPAVGLGFKLTVTNATGSSSANTTVTVMPPKDTINITLVEYRIAKQRLTIDATSSAQAFAVPATLTAQPYLKGAPLGKPQPMPFNKALGLYEVIIVGVAQPDNVIVTSSYGGTAQSPVTKVRTN